MNLPRDLDDIFDEINTCCLNLYGFLLFPNILARTWRKLREPIKTRDEFTLALWSLAAIIEKTNSRNIRKHCNLPNNRQPSYIDDLRTFLIYIGVEQHQAIIDPFTKTKQLRNKLLHDQNAQFYEILKHFGVLIGEHGWDIRWAKVYDKIYLATKALLSELQKIVDGAENINCPAAAHIVSDSAEDEAKQVDDSQGASALLTVGAVNTAVNQTYDRIIGSIESQRLDIALLGPADEKNPLTSVRLELARLISEAQHNVLLPEVVVKERELRPDRATALCLSASHGIISLLAPVGAIGEAHDHFWKPEFNSRALAFMAEGIRKSYTGQSVLKQFPGHRAIVYTADDLTPPVESSLFWREVRSFCSDLQWDLFRKGSAF